jgi:glycosyltransferase involved in cell wall biosynthesis
MRPLRILHVTRELPGDAIYGIRKSLIPVMNALRDRGHEVILLDQEAAGKLPQPMLHRTLGKIVFLYLRLRAGSACPTTRTFLIERVWMGRIAAAYAKKEKIKIVHFHDPLLAYAFRIFAFFFRTKCQWGYTAHAYGRFVKNHIGICIAPGVLSRLQKWENISCRKAGWVIIPSQSGREQLARETGMDAGLPYWYTIPHIVPEIIGDRDKTRKMLGLKPDDILLLAVGQLIPMKRFHLLVEALAHVQSPKSIMALILGNGEEKEKLSALALRLKIRHTLEFRVTDTIGDYLAAADLYVSVSATEAFGMANCEAIKAGIPAICTPGGAVPELLGDAFLMTNGEPVEIARQIDELIEHPELRAEYARRAKLQSASWPGNAYIVDELEKVYNKALTVRRS